MKKNNNNDNIEWWNVISKHSFRTYMALGAFAGSLLSVACASSVIRIDSEPSGAAVILNNKEIGVTPLTLNQKEYATEFNQRFLEVKLVAKNYEALSFMVRPEGEQNIKLSLTPYSDSYFSSTLLNHYQPQTNRLIRDLLYVQGLLVSRKFDLAETALNEFSTKYPNLAAPYVFRANIELSKNNKEQAIRNLERALSIDSQDPTARRMIENIRKE